MKTGALLGALALAGLFAGGVSAQEHGLPDIPVDTFRLENGLLVIVGETHSSPVAAVSVWYQVGNSPEEPDANALAHLIEHLALQESENLAAGQAERLIARAGGFQLAGTDADRTGFLQVVPSNRVNLALWIEADRMRRLVYSDDGLRSQMARLTSERDGALLSRPHARARFAADTLATDFAPYKRSAGLAGAVPAEADGDRLRRFYERYFTPDNGVLAVAGDVDPVQIRSLVEDMFGGIRRGPGVFEPSEFPDAPRRDGERRGRVSEEFSTHPFLSMVFTTPGAAHDDQYALALLVRILGAGRGSRLHRALIHERSLARRLTATLSRRRGPGAVAIDVVAGEEVSLDALEAQILSEVERLGAEPVTDEELSAALNQWKAAEINSRLSARSRVEALQRHFLYFGDPYRINEEVKRYEAVTAGEIQRVAAKYLGAENRAVVVSPSRTGARGARE
ncbi:MAG: M16 family metallopeptidase [Longimicrobiales bacterium]